MTTAEARRQEALALVVGSFGPGLVLDVVTNKRAWARLGARRQRIVLVHLKGLREEVRGGSSLEGRQP